MVMTLTEGLLKRYYQNQERRCNRKMCRDWWENLLAEDSGSKGLRAVRYLIFQVYRTIQGFYLTKQGGLEVGCATLTSGDWGYGESSARVRELPTNFLKKKMFPYRDTVMAIKILNLKL